MFENTFDAEIEAFRKGMPFDATVIIERIKLRSIEYEQNPSAVTLDAFVYDVEQSRTALWFYISMTEKEKAARMAAYTANTERRIKAEKEADAWQMRCIAVSSIVVLGMAFRAFAWLMPVAETYLRWPW